MVIQGRELGTADIGLVQGLLIERPEWGRTRLSEELCRQWNWRNAQGRFKDMAARTLLLKLERAGGIHLPPRQRPSSNGFRNRRVPVVAHATDPICGALRDLRPLVIAQSRARFGRPAPLQRSARSVPFTWGTATRWARISDI